MGDDRCDASLAEAEAMIGEARRRRVWLVLDGHPYGDARDPSCPLGRQKVWLAAPRKWRIDLLAHPPSRRH